MDKEKSLNLSEEKKEKETGVGIFQNLINKSLLLLTFVLPFFWAPYASSSYEFGKHQILLLLSSIAFLAWSAKVILKDKKISFDLNLLDLSVFAFLLVGIASTVFSLDSYISLFGSYGIFSNGLIATLSLGIVYFLVRAAYYSKSGFSVKELLKTFFISFAIVLLVTYFSVLGIGKKLNIEMSAVQQRVFNPISFSLEGVSVFVAAVMVLLTGIITCGKLKEKNTYLKILLFASLVLLIILDVFPAWVVLLVGLSVFTLLALFAGSFKSDIHQLLLPIFLVIISVLFIFIDLGSADFLNFPAEQYLGQEFSYEIALNTIKENTKQSIIGSGLGTWKKDFLKNRSVKFNKESVLWSSRLSKAGNYISELLATMGGLGILSYALLIIFSLYGFSLMEKKKKALPYIATLMAVLAGQFVYYQNTALAFLAWFILGLGAVVWKEALSDKFVVKETLSSSRLPEWNLGFSVLLILLGLAVIGGLYFSTKEALADSYYVKAQQANKLDTSISHLKKAIRYDPYRVNYRTFLSQVYLSQAFKEFGKPAEKQDRMIIQGKISKILDQVEILKNDFSNHVAAWETIGIVRRDVKGSVEGAIDAFKKALELDQKNPTVYTEIGKLYTSSGNMEKARENYQKAQELKSNYFNAYLLEALSYEEKDIDKAISKLKEVEEKFPTVAETKFQLGRLYRKKGKTDLAISYLIETIQRSPNHSNALYTLGQIYEEKGRLQTAIAAYQRVKELNPNNQQVADKIKELKKKTEE